MPVSGSHALDYSTEPEKVREIFRDVSGFDHLDAGDGWSLFAIPRCVGTHPADEGPSRNVLAGTSP